MKKYNLLCLLVFALFFSFAKGFCFSPKKTKDPSIVFVILAHAKNDKTNDLWKRSYNSVRRFYSKIPIVIIDDNSVIPISNDKLKNTTIIRSEYPAAGELLPYYYFLKHRWAEKMIFLHDSMFLNRPFKKEELHHSVKFHWHFSDHTMDIICPIDDLLNYLNHSEDLIDYNNTKQDLWYGCFGVTCLIDIKVLEDIENKYAFTERLKSVICTRVQRMALERVFAILLFKEQHINKQVCSNFGDIFNFPKCFQENLNKQELKNIISKYSGAIIKTWHGR